jgi:hypothetical protein
LSIVVWEKEMLWMEKQQRSIRNPFGVSRHRGKMIIHLWRFAHNCLPSGIQLMKGAMRVLRAD